MKHRLLAVGMAALLALACAATAAATTTRIPYQILGSQVVGFTPPVERIVGSSYHASGMVLSLLQDSDVDLMDGTLTITVNYVFGGPFGDNAWGSETLASSRYPGEGFTCTLHGQWTKDGVRHMYDHCFGYGPHLTGWQSQSEALAVGGIDSGFSGVVWNPGQ